MEKEKWIWFDFFSKKSSKKGRIFNALKSNFLFSHLDDQEIEDVQRYIQLRHYEPQEVIFDQYEKGLGMYILMQGSVEVKMPMQNLQQETFITTLSAGAFFGELALVDIESRRTASAYAITNTTLLGFFKPDLLELSKRKPATGLKIYMQLCAVLGKRLLESQEKNADIPRPLFFKGTGT